MDWDENRYWNGEERNKKPFNDGTVQKNCVNKLTLQPNGKWILYQSCSQKTSHKNYEKCFHKTVEDATNKWKLIIKHVIMKRLKCQNANSHFLRRHLWTDMKFLKTIYKVLNSVFVDNECHLPSAVNKMFDNFPRIPI